MSPTPQACERCGQPTRNFWLADDEGLSPWCNFCVTAQVIAYVGSARWQGFVTVFARAIDSGRAEDVRSVSLALRSLSTLLHDAGSPEGPG